MSQEKTGYSLRLRSKIHRITKEERDKLLNILFDWSFAERIVKEHLTYKDIQAEIEEKYGITTTYAQLKNLSNRWRCDYDADNNIKRIYRV